MKHRIMSGASQAGCGHAVEELVSLADQLEPL